MKKERTGEREEQDAVGGAVYCSYSRDDPQEWMVGELKRSSRFAQKHTGKSSAEDPLEKNPRYSLSFSQSFFLLKKSLFF